jgi:hypothetical protein
MSPELTEIVLLFFGGIAISSFWLLINLVASYHPYHNPALPFFSVFISGAIAIFITAALSENISTIEATRIALTNGGSGLLQILPFAYVVFLFFLLKASFRRRPQDPLLALLDEE